MTADAYILFETAIGCCGLAWNASGIAGVQLPESDTAATAMYMQRRFPQARACEPSIEAQQTLDQINALLRGEASDLTAIRLDMRGVPPFHQRVYQVARGIAPGSTMTYGEVALRLELPGAARAVGQALGRNPFALIVPCHRVLAANGKLGGFSAGGGVAAKRRLLMIEGALASTSRDLFGDDDAVLYQAAPRQTRNPNT